LHSWVIVDNSTHVRGPFFMGLKFPDDVRVEKPRHSAQFGRPIVMLQTARRFYSIQNRSYTTLLLWNWETRRCVCWNEWLTWRAGYCVSPSSLRSICAQIRVETTLHTLVRSESLLSTSLHCLLRPSITQVSTTCHILTSVVHRYYITFHEVLSWHNVLWIVQQKTSFPVSNSWSVNTLLWSLLCVGVYCGQIIAQHGLLSLSTLHECDCVMLREQIQRRRHLVLSTTHTTSGIQTTWQGHVIRPSRTPSRVSVTPSTCCISNAVLHEM